ncbi:MAG TPA: DUF695 domain-containing protein [Fimbriimonadaceae bacterium]|nr:DUF695 domain-containing protein [Fimbriimonadaceae bacterium]
MADALPEARHRRRAWLTLRYVPEPNQMPSKADLEVFQRIEDELTAKLEEDRLGDLVAVVTLAGKRDHLIYFSEEEQVVKTVAAVMRPFAKYRPEVEISDDPNWDELRNMMG